MTYAIDKSFAFSASHQLRGLPTDHQCARFHGHNYEVKVRLTAERLDGVGFVLDYGDLAPFKAWLDGTFDHRHLNDVMGPNPTAENLAVLLCAVVLNTCAVPDHVTVSVGVSETPKTWAWWTP